MMLNDGNSIPQIGIASFRCESVEQTLTSVKEALRSGIRHFEISELFGNGHTIVQGCVEEGIRREEIFITLRIWPKERNEDDLKEAFQNCLLSVGHGLEYVDLALVHAPIDVVNRTKQWKALESLQEAGYVKSLGVTNISSDQLADLLKNCVTLPAVFEMEVSPFNQRFDLVDVCGDNSILILDNEPLAKNVRSKHPILVEISRELSVNVEQVMIQWATAKGFAVLLPPTFGKAGIDVGTVTSLLSSDIMRRLDSLETSLKTTWIPVEEDEQ